MTIEAFAEISGADPWDAYWKGLADCASALLMVGHGLSTSRRAELGELLLICKNRGIEPNPARVRVLAAAIADHPPRDDRYCAIPGDQDHG